MSSMVRTIRRAICRRKMVPWRRRGGRTAAQVSRSLEMAKRERAKQRRRGMA